MAADIERTVPEAEPKRPVAQSHEITREQERYAIPPVDIYEKEDALTVLADLPGVRPEGLSIQVENGVLTIEGKVDAGSSESALWREFELTPFYRQFRIAETIDAGAIRAALKNGVLELTLPKVAEAKPRRIDIEVS